VDVHNGGGVQANVDGEESNFA